MLIDGALLGDVGIQLSNADEALHVAAWLAFGNFDLVEVAGGVVID